MKETVHANIGSQTFTIDQDAYGTLQSYLSDIRARLPEEDTETIGDIEVHMSEILHSKLGGSTMRVVTLEMVREAMAQMGAPSDFGERRDGDAHFRVPQKLYRSRIDRAIGGVCAGIAQYMRTDTTMVRLLTLALIIFGGLSFWIYIILWIVLPEEPLYEPNKTINTDKV